MYTFHYGGKDGKKYGLDISPDLMVVRTQERLPLMRQTAFHGTAVSRSSHQLLGGFDLVMSLPEAGVEVLRVRKDQRASSVRDQARKTLKKEPAIRFAGRVLCHPRSKALALYTENFFVKFEDDVAASTCRKLLSSYKLKIRRELEYARNAYFISAAEGTGLDVFRMAEKLLREKSVELCHPELIRQVRRRQAFPMQWHLKKTTIGGQVIDQSANVEAAWSLSQGEGITIAVIDDGVDLEHEEFRSSGKIVAPRDATNGTDNPRPRNNNNHGTACAGVACADGNFGASGVAPRARLIPIRLVSSLGSQNEADAFVWAAQNGADIISCSWGPEDGDFEDASDPLHHHVEPLPDSTRLAMEFALNNGRNGRGCVITFAAGNGNESVDNDGYASFDKVIAVAACNDVGVKSPYSDFGKAVWCSFPSNNFFPSKTTGIWTTDRSGTSGYNPGILSQGDAVGNYTNNFGGTSSACPGVAGVAALILSRNPALRWDEVRDILKRSCDKIDPAGGNYDAAGRSDKYGFGRVNTRRAVELATGTVPVGNIVTRSVVRDVPIRDLQTATLKLDVADAALLRGIRMSVDLEHTFIGDLIVRVKSPSGLGIAPLVLHNRTGGGTRNLKKTYDTISVPGLAAFTGKSPGGRWILEVQDKEAQDVGKIRSFTLELNF